MTVCLEQVDSVFGPAFIVTATKDKYHRTIVREFFSYADAQSFCNSLLKHPLDGEFSAMFKRKGL